MKKYLLTAALCALSAAAMAQTTLGGLTFNDNQFGDTLIESDGGTFSSTNWLNTVNADPGNPGYLTGANFDTGIANIGNGASPTYTIGYNTPIVNNSGNDFAIVVARFSTDDVQISLSEDGSTFGGAFVVSSGTFTISDPMNYYYNGGGPVGCQLYYSALDLTDFGIGAGNSVKAINVTVGPNSDQLDLIRVAGLNAVPEPTSMVLLGAGALALFRKKRRA